MEKPEDNISSITGKLNLPTAPDKKELTHRHGYDENFLGIKVPLPKLDKDLQKHIAINHHPGRNGDKVLDYTRFSLVYNKTKKLPFFTAVNIEGDTAVLAKEHERRVNAAWYKDERIKKGTELFQFGHEDYMNSGFQKGHMVRYYDPAWGDSDQLRKQAMKDTFCYTNCCPQIGLYNAGLWNDLEDYYMARAVFQDKRLTVFSGPLFHKAKRINKLLVPVNFWKVVVYINPEKQLEAIAFLVSHELAFDQMSRESLIVEDKLVKPKLDKEDVARLFNDKNLKKWVVKLDLIEAKAKIKFKLDRVDLNKQQASLFHVNVKGDSDANSLLTSSRALRANEEDFTAFIKAI